MPWQVYKDGNQWCVHKLTADGERGERVPGGCHPSESEAERHQRALEANVEEMIEIQAIGEFRGNFPDVPVATGVNLDELRNADNDPFFVTLPIIPEIGAVSKSGLLYDEALAERVVEQINRKRPGGRLGHLKPEERSTAYPIPEGIWVGAMRHGNGVWAKSYIPPGPTRDHMRRVKAVGGQISTSIYGTGSYEQVKPGVRRTPDFELETVDFAPPERAALGHGATPIVTAEMNQNGEQEADMDRDELIAELRPGDIPDRLRQAIIEQHEQDTGQQRRIAELEQNISDRDTLIAELQQQAQERQVAEFHAQVDTQIAELTNWETKTDEQKNKLEALRRMLRSTVLAELGEENDADKLKTTLQEIWEANKALAETVRDALAGPAAMVSGKVRDRASRLEDTPENRRKARAEWGI